MTDKSAFKPLFFVICLCGLDSYHAQAAYLALVSPGYLQADVKLGDDVTGGSVPAWNGPNSLEKRLSADEPTPNFSIAEASTLAPYRGSNLELEFRSHVYTHGSVDGGSAMLYTRYNQDAGPIPVQIQPYPFGEVNGQPVRVNITATYRPSDGVYGSASAPGRNLNAYRVTINGGDLLPTTYDIIFAQAVVTQSASLVTQIGSTFNIGMILASFANSTSTPGAPAGLASAYLGVNMSVTVLDEPPPQSTGDFNHDDAVDGHDFLVWQRNTAVGSLANWQANYGQGASAISASVPEPGANLPAGALLAMLSIRSTHRRRGGKELKLQGEAA